MTESLKILAQKLQGELQYDNIHRKIYATDASVYREIPLAVAYPQNTEDIQTLVLFARSNGTSLIPRGAGTSLAGQVVGKGIVVDVSKHFNHIINLDTQLKQVSVQPGVVLDELNKYLEEYGLFFGPETSTSNRCTIGGMVGNNACGTHSLVYGSTRDKLVSLKAVLSDGSRAEFKELSNAEFARKCVLSGLEGDIYRKINAMLSDEIVRNEIAAVYPDKIIHRRNTGYALDLLADTRAFSKQSSTAFNMCKLLAGSEGTLAFTTEITLQLSDLPPARKALLAVHLSRLDDAFRANLIALKHQPSAVELIDRKIIELAEKNKGLDDYRFFLDGKPEAVLLAEIWSDSEKSIQETADKMIKDFKTAGYGYAFPVVYGEDIKKVWHLRKSGLGVLSNMSGDARPVALVEDTAVAPEKLPDYMQDFKKLLKEHSLDCVFYSHIGSGELHLRPILNLKRKSDVELFRLFGRKTAELVKKYGGSLSGEHGDGRLRGEFIPLMYGDNIYNLFKELKHAFDPEKVLNPGKITHTPPMNHFLRYEIGKTVRKYKTTFDFTKTEGILRAAEKCNGSADCRKSDQMGGTLCPSFMAAREEKNSTRARANMLREVLTRDGDPFKNKDLYDVLDLCLSCKACKTECPSGVDVAKLKAEFLQNYYEKYGSSKRSRMIANIPETYRLLSKFPGLSNRFMKSKIFKKIMKAYGFHPDRTFPKIEKSFIKVLKPKNEAVYLKQNNIVYLFADEFTSYTDTRLAVRTYLLLTGLGYRVIVPPAVESGRSYLSKGFVKKARDLAEENTMLLSKIINSSKPLVGIEPSAILSFRDEYPELVGRSLKQKAKRLASNSFTIEEFLEKEMKSGEIKKEAFTCDKRDIYLHGHCQQKALSGTGATRFVLSFPENYRVEEIPSGCCGMAGSFGFEAEHYDLSMNIGEMILFPAVRETAESDTICAPGTSCRHQILEGTGRKALHPAEILWQALSKEKTDG